MAASRGRMHAHPVTGAFISLWALIALAIFGVGAAHAQACDPTKSCCAAPGGGSPCGGSATATQGSTSGVNNGAGNPIDVVTGNKYQREVDMAALPGVLGLEIVRHYNSALSGLEAKNGILGRGWRLSYETELKREGGEQLQLLQADGTRIMFRQDKSTRGQNASWRSADASQGIVTERRSERGQVQYIWRWAGAGEPTSAGRELLFDEQGKLLQISAPSGEFVSLQYDARGWLVSVRDPQGRELHLNYLDKREVAADRVSRKEQPRFSGVQSIDSPVGRYAYEYGSEPLRAGAATATTAATTTAVAPIELSGNLVRVRLPSHYDANHKAHAYANRGVSSSSVSRLYHYEDPSHPTLLTGISVSGQGSDGVQMQQRIGTYAYDRYGRANLSVRGEPARLARDDKGHVIEPKRLAEGTGIEQVTLVWPRAGLVVLTNSLGQETVYKTTSIAGQARLLEARGAGCTSCGPSNMRYAYDAQGRLSEETRLNAQGQPIQTERREYDAQGRLVRTSRVAYVGDRAQPAQWSARYEYANEYAARSVAGAAETSLPTLIATPSIVPGREHLIRIAYNAAGQPTELTESGYSPLDPRGQPSKEGSAIQRTTTYAYTRINGRSLLSRIDGPLPNGPKNSPEDSDVTQIEYDARGDHAVSTSAPGGLLSRFEYDTTSGRLIRRVDAAGVATRYDYEVASLATPSRIERAGRASEYLFDALGRVAKVSESAARGITLRYDSAGHLVAVIDAQGYKAQTTLNAEGQALVAALYEPEQTSPLRATYRWYDDQRRLTKRLRADGRLDTWRYDEQGELVEHVDADDVKHLVLRNAAGLRADIDLAPDGLVDARLSDARLGAPAATPGAATQSGVPTIRRDDFGRPVFEWRPEQGLKLRVFDMADHLVREDRLDRSAKAAGHLEQTYDAAGRPRRRVNFDAQGRAAQTIGWTYDGARLMRQSDDAQDTEYAYDAAGRVSATRITLKDEQGRAAYDTTLKTSYGTGGETSGEMIGEVSAKTLADGQVMRVQRRPSGVAQRIELQSAWWASVHDQLGRWLPARVAPTLQGWLPRTSVVSDIEFHPYNGITGYTQGNGIATSKAFDIAGRLKAIKAGEQRSRYDYEIGPRIRAIETLLPGTQQPVKTTYEYNGFGSLIEADRPKVIKTAFGAGTNASSPVAQRDGRGRTISDGRYRYTYTETGQIETVSEAGRLIAKYRYNAQSQRVSKTVSQADGTSRTSYFLWSQGKLVAEIEGQGEHRGQLSAQYLYLGEQGLGERGLGDESRSAPIAKLEASWAEGNRSAHVRTLYVHADHRGAPAAMTDEKQRVVWRAQSDAWGYVQTEQLQSQEAVMNLRLPGQYFDAETGLHDNWHRSYDARPGSPTRGSYLSPDPSGYPDGLDAYAYVAGDPINRVDPLGLYEEDIHYYMTYFLAIAAGIDERAARTIALADQYVDDNDATKPVDGSTWLKTVGSVFGNQQRLLRYHFVLSNASGKVDPASNNSNISNPISFQLDDLFSASLNAPTPCGRFQFLGEYLHAFEDTFAHRDRNNVPYDALQFGLGLGHGLDGHDPDYTYDHQDKPGHLWTVNLDRTFEMELEVFHKLQAYGDPSKAVDEVAIAGVLWKFNTIEENGGNTEDFGKKNLQKRLDSAKIQLLNSALGSMGYVGIDLNRGQSYDQLAAAQNRSRNLCDSNGLRLKQSDYPGTILPTTGACSP